MDFKLSLNKFAKLLVVLQAILIPMQTFTKIIFHISTFFQLFYVFIFLNFIIIFSIPLKKIIKSQNKYFILLFLLYIFAIILSVIINYQETISKGMDFTYYVNIYSPFLDSPTMRLAWGIINPLIFLIYIIQLFIILRINNHIKLFIKTLIYVGIVSSIYAMYQFLGGIFHFPYGSIFAGAERPPIMILGIIRRCEGIFYEPGPHAAFLSPIYCLLFYQMQEKNNVYRLFSKKRTTFFYSIVFIGIILTISPIGFLTIFLNFIFSFILNLKEELRVSNIIKSLKKTMVIVSILFILISTINIVSKSTQDDKSLIIYWIERIAYGTFGGLENPLVYTNPDQRSVRNYVAIKIFKDYPIFGCGPNNAIIHFYYYAPFAHSHDIFGIILRDKNAVLNQHLKILCETGLLGFTFYLLIILYPFYLYRKNRKKSWIQPRIKIIKALIISLSLFILLSMQTTLQFYLHIYWFYYVSLVILLTDKNSILLTKKGFIKCKKQFT